MLVENIAFDKLVEAHWSGEDRVWHTLRAEYHSSDGANREVWRAQASFNLSDDASLPGDIEFALRYRVLGEDYWDNNESRNYFSNADSGVLLEQNVQILNIDLIRSYKTGNSTIQSRSPYANPCSPSTCSSTGRLTTRAARKLRLAFSTGCTGTSGASTCHTWA